VGVLLGSSDGVVPVASSDCGGLASSLVDVDSDVVSEGWSGVDVAEVALLPSPVIVGPADVTGSSVVSVAVAGGSLVVGVVGSGVVAVVSCVVSCVVDSSEVVGSADVVGATELLVVTPVPTICRLFGMTP
jgi:hypothetical protein